MLIEATDQKKSRKLLSLWSTSTHFHWMPANALHRLNDFPIRGLNQQSCVRFRICGQKCHCLQSSDAVVWGPCMVCAVHKPGGVNGSGNVPPSGWCVGSCHPTAEEARQIAWLIPWPAGARGDSWVCSASRSGRVKAARSGGRPLALIHYAHGNKRLE